MRDVSTVLRAFAASAVVLMVGATAPAHADKVSCDKIDLTFDAGGDETYCHAGTDSGRNAGSSGAIGWGTQWQLIGLDTNERSIVAQHVRANNRTYFEKGDVRGDVDGDPWFTDSRNWGEVRRVGDYEVQEFEGTWKGASGFWRCAGFTRYSRPVASGGAGYAERVGGAYCVAPGRAVAANELSHFLDSIGY